MLFLTIFLSFALSLGTITSIHAHNFHDQLIIPTVYEQDPLWSCAGYPIHQKEDGAYAQLMQIWDQQLKILWADLAQKIHDDIQVSKAMIDYNLSLKDSAQKYMAYHASEYQDALPDMQEIDLSKPQLRCMQVDINPEILNFIELKYNFIHIKKPIFLICKDDVNYLAASFGSDISGHYLICNSNFYASKTIESLYSLTEHQTIWHFEPHQNIHLCVCIETPNLLHLGLTQAISGIVHQSDFFVQIFKIFTCNNKLLSNDLQRACTDYVAFRSYLEACLQSKNPLEAARYLIPENRKAFDINYHVLWSNFIQDIKNAYNEDDLASYEEYAFNIKKDLFERSLL